MKVEKKPSVEEVKRVFVITSELTRTQFPFPTESWSEKWMTKITKIVSSHSSFIIAILFVMVIAGGLIHDSQILRFTIAGSTAVAVVGYSIILAWIPVRLAMFWRVRKDPYCIFLELLESRLPFVAGYLDRLVNCDLVALKMVRQTYAAERKQYQERGESLSGAITKLGIFPGVAVAILLGAQLTAYFGFGNWIVSMVSLILIFHVINFAMTRKLHQMDRVIMVLDLAIDQASD